MAVDPAGLENDVAQQSIAQAAQILRSGGLVAFPTETVYGLGANALDAAAVARIFAAKQRPAWDPVIVHIADVKMLDGLVRDVPDAARKLMDAYWPGPLTLLLPRSAAVPDAVTAGRPLVGVRMPAHPVALELIRKAGIPIAAPSANTFSHTSPTTATHVLDDLDGRIDAILDAGAADRGVESTVLDPCSSPMVIYRPGAITLEQVRDAAGPVEFFRKAEPLRDVPVEALPSPGVGLRHYAPRAKLILVDAPEAEIGARLTEEASHWPGERMGVMLPGDVAMSVGDAVVFPWGRLAAPAELARDLYAGLRTLDAQGCTAILCPFPAADGIGEAVRDRLRKAAKK